MTTFISIKRFISLVWKVYIFDCAFDNDFINFQGHFQVNYYEINDFFTDILIYIRNGDMIGVLLYTLALFFVFSVKKLYIKKNLCSYLFTFWPHFAPTCMQLWCAPLTTVYVAPRHEYPVSVASTLQYPARQRTGYCCQGLSHERIIGSTMYGDSGVRALAWWIQVCTI